jgi:hypothetical protein
MAVLAPNPTAPSGALTSIKGTIPTFRLLTPLVAELRAVAISVASTGGNGGLGHLALVVSAAEYTATAINMQPPVIPDADGILPAVAVAPVVFVAPVHPGALYVPAAGLTAAQRTEGREDFKDATKASLLWTTTDTRLKQLLLDAIDDEYISVLKDENNGYALVPTLRILEHLMATYGTISDHEASTNSSALTREWDPSTSIESLWNHFRTVRHIATAAHAPIADIEVVRAAITIFENTGHFSSAITSWYAMNEAARTYDALRLHFGTADKERRRKLTAKTAGFHSAAAATEHALVAPAAVAPPGPRFPFPYVPYYCWSHGFGPYASHTSATCTYPVAGHQKEATWNEMMGGCNLVHRNGEEAIWVQPSRNRNRSRKPAPNAS